tara:strand:- start:38 stop:319 length:282 start_codon:yes stop_codon:yes gene_type:complete
MKISKEKLLQIITEELDNMTQEPEDAEDESKEKFRQRMVDMSGQLAGLSLDNDEIVLINDIFTIILKYANDKSGADLLTRLKDLTVKKLGVKQ